MAYLRELSIGCAAALTVCASAHAMDISLAFSGAVSPGSTGTVSPYDPNVTPGATNFDGQPFTLFLSISGSPADLWVSGFSTVWSNQAHDLPYITSWGGTGFPNDGTHDQDLGFLSTVSLTNTGGSISLTPTFGFIAMTDADFNLSVNFTFSSPHNPFSTFTDNGTTGGGSFSAFETFIIDPVIGPYDASSAGNFTLSGFSQFGVPEPQTWAMMLIGFGALGVAMRNRRNMMQIPDAPVSALERAIP